MRSYTPDEYSRLVEASENKGLQDYMEQEAEFITRTPDALHRTFVDLGAGHGRVISTLADTAHEVIAIEINPEMYAELERRSGNYKNVTVIAGDFNDLAGVLSGFELIRPVFLILQNTLGTVEGDYRKTLQSMRECAEHENGELVISLFRQEALATWGLAMYKAAASMVGNYDAGKSNLDEGIFCTDTSHMSKWWTDKDIKEILRQTGGTLLEHRKQKNFSLLRITY
ncbi:MAG TPA: class I SAM-dependent methyltransferase [Candidatus Saccharimonadales bacterium]|nr:class I SAM-dependent methyltransferase [Candidatus Saccharimonadales bacterium]